MNIKTFEVDWDSYKDVHDLGQKIKSQLGNLNPNRISRKEKTRQMLSLCLDIFNTNIDSVYTTFELDDRKIYYVYAHLDTTHSIAIGRQGITTFAATLGMKYFPFYIGKGTGDRCFNLNRNETHRKVKEKIRTLNKEPEVLIIRNDLTEKEALCMESKLIDIFGLISVKGMLTNLDEGKFPDERRACYREQFNQLNIINRML